VAMTDFPFSGMARMATGATGLGCPTSRWWTVLDYSPGVALHQFCVPQALQFWGVVASRCCSWRWPPRIDCFERIR
jgi:hypothetical protein